MFAVKSVVIALLLLLPSALAQSNQAGPKPPATTVAPLAARGLVYHWVGHGKVLMVTKKGKLVRRDISALGSVTAKDLATAHSLAQEALRKDLERRGQILGAVVVSSVRKAESVTRVKPSHRRQLDEKKPRHRQHALPMPKLPKNAIPPAVVAPKMSAPKNASQPSPAKRAALTPRNGGDD